MHHSSRLSSFGSQTPSLLGLALVAGVVALLSGACGGSASDDGLSAAGPGAGGGQQTAGTGGAGAGGAAAGSGTAGGGQGGAVCVPGAQVACPCPGTSVKGVQSCTADGQGLSACIGCPSGQGGSAGTGGTAAGGKAGTGGTAAAGAGDAGAGDAGAGGTDLFHLMPPAQDAACYSCLITDCKSQVQACNDDPDCEAAAACLIQSCLDKMGNALISCALGTCGINPQGPAAQLALPIANCLGNQCKGDCASVAMGGGGTGGQGQAGQGQAGQGQAGQGEAGQGQGGSDPGDPGSAPDKVGCGTHLCDTTKGEDCCVAFNSTTPDFSCKAAGQCKGGFVNIEQPCDGPEDCEGGKLCCAALGIQSKIGCQDSCGNGQQNAELCHKDADCDAPATCQSCNVMGFAFRVCGSGCPGMGGMGGPGGPGNGP